MKNIKYIILGYLFAVSIHGCDSVISSDNTSSTTNLEYGDYGTVSWNPLYVKIVD